MLNILKGLGPGLLYAGAAVGVSHLVQSTRAGAEFGHQLLWVILIANLLKFPFFEFGPRYVSATGKSLLHGYLSIGKWALWLFIIMTILTMFTVTAAVTVVSAGLAQNITGLNLGMSVWSGIILAICFIICLKGRYSFLDKGIKAIIITLSVTTLIAVVSILIKPVSVSTATLQTFSWSNNAHIFFLIAFMGWMPAPIDVSVWHSLWSQEKIKLEGKIGLSQALKDFHFGYWATVILAIGFLTLGASAIYPTGQPVQAKAVAFASQLTTMYTNSIGSWSYPIISIAAFTTMFSTTLTVVDAYPRVIKKCSELLEVKRQLKYSPLIITVLGSMIVILFFMKSMKQMVDVATIISFLAAPVLAILNYKAITSKSVPAEFRPGKLITSVSWLGIIYLIGFNLFYILKRVS